MKALSHNVKGLGSKVKWKFIQNLVVKEGMQVLFIQETKMEEVSTYVHNAIWGDFLA